MQNVFWNSKTYKILQEKITSSEFLYRWIITKAKWEITNTFENIFKLTNIKELKKEISSIKDEWLLWLKKFIENKKVEWIWKSKKIISNWNRTNYL